MTLPRTPTDSSARPMRRRPCQAFLLAAMVLPGLAGATHAAAPTVDTASSIDTDNTDIVTLSHTTSGTNRLMLVGVGWDIQGGPDITSVTYNGANLTFVGRHTSGSEVRNEIWRLVAPDLGTHNVVVNFDTDVTQGVVVGAMTFTGVDQATPHGSYVGDSGSSSTADVNVPAATNELVFASVVNETQNLTEGSGTTEYWDLDSGGAQGAGGTEPGNGGTVNISWTLSTMVENSTFWGAANAGYGINAASGATIGVRNSIAVDYGTLDLDIDSGATITYFGYNMFLTWGGGFDPDSEAGYNQWPPTDLDELFADKSSLDLHIEVSGNRAGNLGLDLSGVFADDMDGQTRSDDWDIGADEARPGFGPSTPKVMVWDEIEP